MDPYKLPDGPVAIQFSGGRTSGYMVHQILDCYGGQLPQDCHVLFQNTGREMPETLDFVQRCSEEWGQRIVWIEYDPETKFVEVSHNSASRNGEPFEKLVPKRKFVPNRVTRYCTTELKIRPSYKWLRAQGYKRFHSCVGVRYDERHRAKQNMEGFSTNFWPLVAAKITKRHIARFWEEQPFDLQLPNINGSTPLGNCDGCMLKSEKARAWLAKYRPDRAQWWADMEAKTGATFGNPARNEMTWQQLIDHAQRQADWVFDLSDEESLYCTEGFGGCHD